MLKLWAQIELACTWIDIKYSKKRDSENGDFFISYFVFIAMLFQVPHEFCSWFAYNDQFCDKWCKEHWFKVGRSNRKRSLNVMHHKWHISKITFFSSKAHPSEGTDNEFVFSDKNWVRLRCTETKSSQIWFYTSWICIESLWGSSDGYNLRRSHPSW